VRKLPSLTKLDGLNHLCLLVGFPILSLGIAVGILSAKRVWGEFWKWDPKEFWALITWLLYAALIHGRLVFGWKGRKAAVGAILGFFAIIATIVVIGYFSKGKYGGMPL
jgi:ABC-type transport system involved in cytochrome c biogenesis permease subunit